MNYVMPAEWERHERTWMAWPTAGYSSVPDESIDEAYAAWANVANAIVRFEPLTMVVDPRDVAIAQEWLEPEVQIVTAALDDAWMRDMGPTFVRAADGSMAAVDWVFNGWGAQHWAKWDHDSEIAPFIINRAGVPTVDSPLVNEGGGIHVNGRGTLLATKTVQFDTFRNPDATVESVEAEFNRTLGVDEVIWFERGLSRDYEDFGTKGHVDIVGAVDGEVVASFDAATSSRLTFAGDTLTINPGTNLSGTTQYFVTFDSGAVQDLTGNAYAGAAAQNGMLAVDLMQAGVTGINIPRMYNPVKQSRDQVIAWRGPILDRALQQFLADVWWGDLDVLLLDLPPGTGDVAISVAQLLPNAELIVVTTPQALGEAALATLGKAIHT